MIIETSDNRFYRVTETGRPGLDHCWDGVRVKKVRVKRGRKAIREFGPEQ